MESVVLQQPLALALYGAALFLVLFDRTYRATKGIFTLLSTALAAVATAYSLLMGAALWECATVLLVFPLLTSTAVDYCCSWGIERSRGNKAVMKPLLLVSFFVNLGLLFTFKYFDFFAGTVNGLCAVIGLPYRVPELGLILPVGISFYTFQTMSCTIDVYRETFTRRKTSSPLPFTLPISPSWWRGPLRIPGT